MRDKHKYEYIQPCVTVNTGVVNEIRSVELNANAVMFYGKETGVRLFKDGYEFHADGACAALKELLDDFLKGQFYLDFDYMCGIISAITGMELEYTKEFLKDGVDKVFQNGQPRVFKPVDEEE